ncbi:MAG: hypothetical protein JRN54_02830, partial [Nitrososphaerota archaeon]|nr:hypothetical protein [Nitrososphaerota archaeon]
NAVREALRRLGIFLSHKGSMEAVQKKMNIYGKYLPLIAQFSTELAGKKSLPKYRQLIGSESDGDETNEAGQPEGGPADEAEGENVNQEKSDQEAIDRFS